jgi:site-specific recombinase XerD
MRITPEINKRRVQMDGTCAVRLIVWINNTRATIPMTFSVAPSKWDDKRQRVKVSHTRHPEYNHAIGEAIALAEDYAVKHPRAIAKEVRAAVLGGPIETNMIAALRTAKDTHTEKFAEATRVLMGTMIADVEAALPHVQVGGLTVKHVQHFHRALLGKELHQNTIRHRLKIFRLLYNVVLEDRGLPECDCFKGNIPAQRATRRRFLDEDQLNALFTFQPPVPDLVLTRHAFLLQMLLGGMRVSDLILLRPDSFRIKNKVLEMNYDMKKTGVDRWVPVPKQARDIIEHYAGGTHVLPFFTGASRNQIGGATARLNRNLKVIAALCGVDPRLSTHYARHTFGDWARREAIDLKTLQMIFGHKSIMTTMGYMATFANKEVAQTFADLERTMPANVL